MLSLSNYLRVTEASQFLGVAPNTLRAWAKDGKVPMHRNPNNGYRLFKREDLEELLRDVAKPMNAPQKSKKRRKPR